MSEVVHLVAVLGRGVVDADEPVVTADDLGLTRGDGCFDSVRVITDAAGHARAGRPRRPPRPPRGLRRHHGHSTTPPTRSGAGSSRRRWPPGRPPARPCSSCCSTRGREWQTDPRPTALVTITHRGSSPAPDATGVQSRATHHHRGHPDPRPPERRLRRRALAARRREDPVLRRQHRGHARGPCGAGPTTSSSPRPTATPSTAPRPACSSPSDGAFVSTPTGATGILESLTVAAVMDAARADGYETRYELVPVAALFTADAVCGWCRPAADPRSSRRSTAATCAPTGTSLPGSRGTPASRGARHTPGVTRPPAADGY